MVKESEVCASQSSLFSWPIEWKGTSGRTSSVEDRRGNRMQSATSKQGKNNKQQASAPQFLRGALFHLEDALEPKEKAPPTYACCFLCPAAVDVTAMSTSLHNNGNLSPNFTNHMILAVNFPRSTFSSTPSTRQDRQTAGKHPSVQKKRGTPPPTCE